MNNMNNHSRSGFLLLMLIAFTSIILGLSTTFYLYCRRGLDDSLVAVRIAQQRLALAAAIYKVNSSSDISVFATPTWVKMEFSDQPLTKNLGWYRIAKATNAYISANMAAFGNLPAANLDYTLVVTSGTGPSRGDPATTIEPDKWRYELRTWYVVSLNSNVGTSFAHIYPMLPKPDDGQW